jgi:hypothetical protein
MARNQSCMKSRKGIDCLNHLIAVSVCLVIVCGFLAVSPACFHWFIVPVFAAGVISAGELVKWVRSRTNMFNPSGLVAAAAFYSCFITPPMHVALDQWMAYVVPPDDWRPWLGIVGVLNSIGLLLYKAVINWKSRRTTARVDRWSIDYGRFTVVILAAICISVFVQIYMLANLGGYRGMLDLFLMSIKTGEDTMAGLGWAAAFGESIPMLLVLAYAVVARCQGFLKNWVCLACMLVSVFVLQLIIGGYRGSRGNTVWTVIWAVGIVHLWLRRIPRTAMWVCLGGLCLFMYAVGFYKAAGAEGLAAARDNDARQLLEQRSGRTVATLLLADFDRSDVQAFAVFSQLTYGADYAFGRTYLGTAALLIPRILWPDRPPYKVKWTTEAEYGKDSYPSVRSSRIYGLTGEALLNFGVVGAPLGFLALGYMVSWVQGLMFTLHPSDTRVLMLPLLVLLCVLALMFDTDNVLWVLVKHGGLPFLVIALSSRRSPAASVRDLIPNAVGTERSYSEHGPVQHI